MCGICGQFLTRPTDNSDRLPQAIAQMLHRGPDEQGIWRDETLGFGHARLSIIDLKDGQQPMHSSDGTLVIVFNGEIYNFQELRTRCLAEGYSFRSNSDTEVILALYNRHGEDCVKYLRGMFAFAIYDKGKKTLFLARDRLGVKPLLYAGSPDGFYFASEMNSLLALNPGLKSEPDWQALTDYFARQYILAPQTPYRAIRKLEPGHTLLIRQGAITGPSRRYWFPEKIERSNDSEQEAVEELRHLFTEATRLRLISEVPLGAFLSGGMDSSITVAVMAKLLGQKIKTYSIGFADQKFDERKYARRVAEHCGTDHEELEVEYDSNLPSVVSNLVAHFGEPFADSSMVPTYYVSKLARQKLTVVLSGDGADETWGGYKRHYQVALFSFLKRYGLSTPWLAARRITTALESMAGKNKSFPVNPLDRLLLAGNQAAELLTCKLTGSERETLFASSELRAGNSCYDFLREFPDNPSWDDVTRFLYYDVNTFLSSGVLAKVDITSMMNSLEVRSPFLDPKVVEFAFSLPLRFKVRNFTTGKWLLRRAFAELLPPGHFDRPKMGFSPPLNIWLRTHLKEWCGDLLASESCRHHLNQPLLQRLFKEHQNGADHGKTLWLSAIFCEWSQQYLNR